MLIELSGTWNTVVMLMVAGGVGLIGGVGAALIEWKAKAAARSTGTSAAPATGTATIAGGGEEKCGDGFLSVFSCIMLGGIAAVAILYFFPPTKEVVETEPGGATVTTTFYELIKLVTLSLIVGSAGTTFLQALQARALNQLNEQKVETLAATADAGSNGVARSVPDVTTSSLQAQQSDVAATLSDQAGLSPAEATTAAASVIDLLKEQVPQAVGAEIQKKVDDFNVVVASAASGEAPKPAG